MLDSGTQRVDATDRIYHALNRFLRGHQLHKYPSVTTVSEAILAATIPVSNLYRRQIVEAAFSPAGRTTCSGCRRST